MIALFMGLDFPRAQEARAQGRIEYIPHMMIVEAVFWLGMATLTVGGWKILTCLLKMAFQRQGSFKLETQHDSIPDELSDWKFQIERLRKERDMLESEISLMRKKLRGDSEQHSRADVVYVASNGRCSHLNLDCQYVKNRSVQELHMCSVCSKKGSQKSQAA